MKYSSTLISMLILFSEQFRHLYCNMERDACDVLHFVIHNLQVSLDIKINGSIDQAYLSLANLLLWQAVSFEGERMYIYNINKNNHKNYHCVNLFKVSHSQTLYTVWLLLEFFSAEIPPRFNLPLCIITIRITKDYIAFITSL